MGWFDDEFTKRKLDVKQCFDFRNVPHPSLPEDHSRNYDPRDTTSGLKTCQSSGDKLCAFHRLNSAAAPQQWPCCVAVLYFGTPTVAGLLVATVAKGLTVKEQQHRMG
jgi:hypothetical protein